jgi:hypothetical protein
MIIDYWFAVCWILQIRESLCFLRTVQFIIIADVNLLVFGEKNPVRRFSIQKVQSKFPCIRCVQLLQVSHIY